MFRSIVTQTKPLQQTRERAQHVCECLQIVFMAGIRWNPWIWCNLCYQLQLNDYWLHLLPGHTHKMRELEGGRRGGKHTKVYSTYQQSGNPTGSGIRRLAIHTDECELTRNIAEESVLSLAVNLDRFCTGIQIRDLILPDGKVAAGDLGFTNFLIPYSPWHSFSHEGVFEKHASIKYSFCASSYPTVLLLDSFCSLFATVIVNVHQANACYSIFAAASWLL